MSIVTLNDRGVRSVTTFGSLNTGSMVFIKKLTASSSSNLSFINGSSDVVFDSTYKEYVFTFKDIHPSDNATRLKFNASDHTSSHSYDVVKTTTMFIAYHNEGGSASALAYETGTDEAQSTASILEILTSFIDGLINKLVLIFAFLNLKIIFFNLLKFFFKFKPPSVVISFLFSGTIQI